MRRSPGLARQSQLLRRLVPLLLALGQLSLRAQFTASIASPPPPSAEVRLSWSTVPGRIYAVWSTLDLEAPWQIAAAISAPWIAASDRLDLALPRTGDRRYFRIAESPSPYQPAWDSAIVRRNVSFTNDPAAGAVQNGTRLKRAIEALVPGDALRIAAGTYSLDGYTSLDPQGTTDAPIWIEAVPGAAVIITRPDASQNVVNLGANRQARYVCFRGLEFTGGSHGIRLYDCTQVWIDQCRVHHTGDVGISANARDTSFLHLTRNEIWNTGGTGEGMYLGGNNASVIMRQSVIALNHVHHTLEGVSQGDGIEVKQGSWGNVIAENHVHDCHYPCIVVYGTGGQPPNVVERNLCYRSQDNTLQVQGECIVRNNLAMGAAGSAFASQPHQGSPTHLTVVNNTFVNSGTAARLASWETGTAMVFANNACYSASGAALTVVNGAGTTAFAGNVCYGSMTAGIPGCTRGNGAADFLDIAWDATQTDARPSPDSALRGAADGAYAPEVDLTGNRRTPPITTGCYQYSDR